MDLEIGDFFYNIIPGGLFLSIWLYIFKDKTKNIPGDTSLWIIVFTILAFFIGFLLQALWKFIRKNKEYYFEKHRLIKPVIEGTQKEITERGLDDFEFGELGHFSKISLSGDNEDNLNKAYNILSDFRAGLWIGNKYLLPDYFASRGALWGHIFLGSSITIIIWAFLVYWVPRYIYDSIFILIVLIILFIFSYGFYILYRRAEFNTLLRQYRIRKGNKKTD